MLKPLALAAALAVAVTGAAAACSKPSGAAGVESGLISWINAERGKKGLSKLKANGKLDAAAQGHACDMAETGHFGHKVPGGKSFQQRIKGQGYKMRTAVENIAKSPKGASADVAAGIWRDSSGHWSNIMEPALREIGIGVATDGKNVYYVFVGGAPK